MHVFSLSFTHFDAINSGTLQVTSGAVGARRQRMPSEVIGVGGATNTSVATSLDQLLGQLRQQSRSSPSRPPARHPVRHHAHTRHAPARWRCYCSASRY